MKILIQTKIQTILCLLILIAAGCNSTATRDQKAETTTITDDLSREIILTKQPRKVMALAPSLTEMLATIVPDSQIIGRTHQCNYPEWVEKLPVVDVMPLDIEKLLQLKPDIVFTMEGMTSLENAEKLQQLGIPVYYQKYDKVTDIFSGLVDIGTILGHADRARQIADSLDMELAKIYRTGVNRHNPTRIIALAWQDPIMVYGYHNLFTDKVRIAGGINPIDSTLREPYPTITREYLLKLNPDVIISRDFGFAGMDTSFFKRYPELKALKAYKTKRIGSVNVDLMERPTPRVVQSVKEIKALL